MTRGILRRHTVSELERQSDYWLEKQGRLTEPMRYNRATDHYEPIGWDDAFALIGRAAQGAGEPRHGGILHVGPRLERGGVSVSAVRAAIRHQQFSRLLQHVP